MNILSPAGTENTYNLSVVTIHTIQHSKSKFPSERLRSQCFVKRSAALFFVSSSRFVLRLLTVQDLCNLAGVVLELLRLDEICVPFEVSLST